MSTATKTTYLLLVLAELFFVCQFMLVWYPQIGIFASATSIVVLFMFALKRTRMAYITACIGILFAVRLATATFSIEDLGIAAVILYGILGGALFIYALIRSWPRSPFTHPKYETGGSFALMLLLGQFLGLIVYLFLPSDDVYRVLPLTLLVLAAPLAAGIEEYTFRGLLQKDATEKTDTFIGILFTAWIATAFVLSRSTSTVFIMLAVHLVLSAAYARYQNTALTFTANLAMKLTFITLLAMRPAFI